MTLSRSEIVSSEFTFKDLKFDRCLTDGGVFPGAPMDPLLWQ